MTYTNFNKIIEKSFEFYNVNPFSELHGKTLVFFDTETTGFLPDKNQITEIAAIACEGDTLKQLDTFQKYIKLTDDTHAEIARQNAPPENEEHALKRAKKIESGGKTIEQLLAMSGYDADKAVNEEEETLLEFYEFINQFENPILVAHNAPFDMKMVNTRLNRIYKRSTPKYTVMDTLRFSRLFFLPAIQAMAKRNDPAAMDMLNLIKDPKAVKKNDLYKLSSSLGVLNKLIKHRLDSIAWHSALSDVQVTIEIFRLIRDYYNKMGGMQQLGNDELFKRAYSQAYARYYR